MTSSYRIEIVRSAEKELRAVPSPDLSRVVKRIRALASNPRPPAGEKLSGAEGFRVRQGDWRIVYQVDDAARSVLILKIGHRREVYR